MKITKLQQLKKLIKENLKSLNESFKSKKLAAFTQDLRKANSSNKGRSSYNLPDGIQWDKIPDEKVYLKTNEVDIRKYIKPEYLILWFSKEQVETKYRQPTYSRNGFRRNNSQYLPQGLIIITRGRNFLYGYDNLQNRRVADNSYEKPAGIGSVKRLTELNLNALIIDYSVLEEFSSVNLLNNRESQKRGATALQELEDILSDNQDRYKTIINKMKINKLITNIDFDVKNKLTQLKNDINKYIKSDIVTFGKNDDSYHDKDNELGLEIPNVNIDMKKLTDLVSTYKSIVWKYEYYFDYLKKSMGSEFYVERAENAKKELEQLIK